MNMREYIYLCCYRTSANPKMSIKTLSPTVIRIDDSTTVGFGLTRQTRHTFPIVEIPWHSFSTLNIRNSRRRYLRILDDGKVRHRILMRTYWKYSSHLRRKFGEGKYLFYISTGKTFLYISFLHFCIVLANYKYLLEERGEGDFSL